ncbi:fibronectin type III domain-containing protein [Nonomuraea basaltis]|uniref:fibronectin type III domain-containing protein n=1 Tax=Nonomuraea basaltis TaxID=2495887 RepID=UPI00110C436E|nr:fibronectin type III domain-containing protein [Nonomuraea basaltis]TMR91456.1 fibronectin type III domain-containing protein [Nonomuraea basaltis]
MQVIVPGEPMRYGLRLVAYAPNGPRLGVLGQHLGFEVGMPLNDVPSLRLTYSTHAAGAQWLAQPCEIAVEWSAGGAWTEPQGGRFLRIKRASDATDHAGPLSFDAPGWSCQLRKLVLYPNGALVDGKRPFNAATPGAILRTVVDEGQERGALPGLAVDFTLTHDSAGQPWDKLLTIGLDPGADLLTLLINLAEQGVVDWTMQGRVLRAFNEGTTLARDFATGPAPVDLRMGRDIDDAPDDATLEDASSAILIVGENGLQVEVTNPSATAPWGRWETYQSQSGVSDEGTARLLAQYALDRASGERVQHTRQIRPYAARWLPLKDYRPGDTVLAPGDQGVMQGLRVRQITLSCDADSVIGGNLVLNDRFLERDIRLARRSLGILDGGISSGGGGGVPAPDTDGRVPAAPGGLLVEPAAYLDEHGYPHGQATLTWGAVTSDVNGVELSIDGYEVYARRNEANVPWVLIAQTDSSDRTATISPLVVGWEYAFKVRATNDGTKGVFSPQFVVLIPDDSTPPPVPSTPVVAARLGVIHVEWNGKGSAGEAMPIDLDRVHVWMRDPLNPADTGARVGYLTGAGTEVIPAQPYNADREIWLTATDRSGNESGQSGHLTVAVTPLVDTDLIGEVIDGADHIITGSIPAEAKIVAGSITGALIQALEIKAGHIAANAIEADKIKAGAIQAAHISANAIEADKIAANAITAAKIAADAITGKTITGSVVRSAATGQRFILDSATLDLRFYPAGNSNYSRFYAVDGLYPGETTTFITSGTNSGGTARAELQVAAGLVRLGIRNAANSNRRGGGLDVAEGYGRFGYDDGFSSSQSYIHCNSSGRWYLRGRVWDTNTADPYDTIHAGSGTVPPDSGGVTINYGPSMASNMGPVAVVRDGAANPNFYWCLDLSNQSSFSFGWSQGGGVWSGKGFYWWSHRH